MGVLDGLPLATLIAARWPLRAGVFASSSSERSRSRPLLFFLMLLLPASAWASTCCSANWRAFSRRTFCTSSSRARAQRTVRQLVEDQEPSWSACSGGRPLSALRTCCGLVTGARHHRARIDVLQDASEKYPRLLETCATRATHHSCTTSGLGPLHRRDARILAERARGVSVRALYDRSAAGRC